MNLVALHTRGEFIEIHLADFVEGVAEIVGEGGGIPHDITQLESNLMAAFGSELVVVVADDLLDFVGNFASFTGEAEGGIDDGAGGGVDGGAAGAFLIFVYCHSLYQRKNEKWIYELWNCLIAVLMFCFEVSAESSLSAVASNQYITLSGLHSS